MEYWQSLRQHVGHETLILPSAAGAIVKDGKLLLVRSVGAQMWQIPGGLCELGETMQATAQREIKEELGLVMEPRELIAVYSGANWATVHPNGDKIQNLMLFFKMEGEVKNIQLQESEISEYRFVSPGEVPENTMACCKQKVSDYFAYQGQTLLR